MLPRAQRLTSTLDYSRVVRRGARFSTPLVVMHIAPGLSRDDSSSTPARFGFVVSKAIGSAPRRNRVKRQLRALGAALAPRVHGDVVIRALPLAADATWESLSKDLTTCVERWENEQ